MKDDVEVTQADRDAAKSILWVKTIIDDIESIEQAFARHRIAATPPSPPAMVEVATQAMREAGTAVNVADGRGNYTALNWEEAAEVWSVMYLAASLRPQAG